MYNVEAIQKFNTSRNLHETTCETGYIETHLQVFMPDLPKLISRKLLRKIFFHFSHQRKQKNHGCTFCNDVTTTTTIIKQYKYNNNDQLDPKIILALPHPITVLLQPCVLVSFAFFRFAFTFLHVSISGGVAK